MSKNQISRKHIKIGVIFSILASVIYPIYYYLDLSLRQDLIIVLIFALSIAFSSHGIYHFLKLDKIQPCLKIGLGLSVFAAFVFALAGIVRIALQWPLEGILVQGDQSFTYGLNSRVFMAIEFMWKILFGLSIIFLAKPSFSHPKLGKAVSVLGVLFGILIITINIISFPEAPEELNLVAMGPAAPAWHLLVTVLILLSPSWIIEKSTE